MRPIFIIGEQRSGSNLLRLMLSQAGIAAPHPPHILKRMLPLEASYGVLSQDANWRQLTEDICTLVDRNPVPWSEVCPLDRDEVMERCQARSTIAIFGAIMDLYAEAQGAAIWACKSMQYSEFVDDLEDHFTDPLYIYLYRDGRDVALSFQRAVVGEKHPYFTAKRWAKLQDSAAAVQERVGAERCFSLCYERLTHEPEPVLRALCDFIGIPFQLRMLEFHRSSEATSTSQRSQLWQNVGRPLIQNNTQKFLTGLTQAQIEICESVAGPQLDRLGYERVYIPRGSEQTFSVSQLAAFTEENERLKHSHRSAMDAEDAHRRAHQLSILTERVQHLSHISPQHHLRLLCYLEEKHLDDGVTFIKVGTIKRSLYFIIDGAAEVIDQDSETIATITVGNCVGEVGTLTGLPRTRSVRALGPTRVLTLSFARMQHMLRESPELSAQLLWSISVTLAERFHKVT